MPFDVDGARKAGYSESEIADFLGKDAGFDVAGARKSGYKDTEIVQHLAKPISAARMEGRKMTQEPGTNILAGLANAAQGAGFNLADETAGLLAGYGALRQKLNPFNPDKVDVGQAYSDARDKVRGMVEQYRTENPTASIFGQVGGAMAQGGGIGRLFGMGGGVLMNMLRGAGAGGAEGLLRGAGQAETLADIPAEMASEGAMGALGGAAGSAVTQGLGAAARAVAPRIPGALGAAGNVLPGLNASLQANDDAIKDIARRRVAEALLRDQRTPEQAAARMRTLGPEARIADAAGVNTRNLLDTQATLPGQTANRVETAIRDRQAGRGARLIGAASTSLDVGGKRLASTLDELDAQRRAASGPLYDVVNKTVVPLDDELRALLERAKPAYGLAKQIAQARGETFDIPNGAEAPLKTLDQIKRGLYALEEKNLNPETGAVNSLGKAYQELRRTMVDKLDDLTTDATTGQSVYKAARNAYAGPTELRGAARDGFKAMNQDATRFQEAIRDLSESEREAFRVGAMESLRNKFGTMSGQTNILKMWREPATQEKLRALFPDVRSYRDFAVAVSAEERLRQLEQVGRGSQTARRLAAMEDQGSRVASDLAGISQGVTTPGGVATMLKSAKDLYSRLDTPEAVRDEIGKILLLQNMQVRTTQQELRKLSEVLARYNANKAAAATTSGAVGGAIATQE